jgi:hypothetical protein
MHPILAVPVPRRGRFDEGCFHRFEGSVINTNVWSSLSVRVTRGPIELRNCKIVYDVHLEVYSMLTQDRGDQDLGVNGAERAVRESELNVGVANWRDEKERIITSLFSSKFHSSAAENLDDADTTADSPQRHTD